MKKRLFCIALVLLMALPVFAGCAAGPKATTIKQGKLILGTSPDYPPYEFPVVGSDGNMEFVGFDIEVARIIAKDMGLELEIQSMDFDGLLPALQAGAVDVILSGMTPKKDRREAVDFSQIYLYADQAMVVRNAEKDSFKSNDDFNGKIVGAQTGSLQEDIANEIEGADVISLKRIPTLVMELKTNRVDGVLIEKPVADNYVKKNTDLTIAYTIPNDEGEEGVAVAVRKGSDELLKSIDKTLDRIVKDDTIEKLFAEAIALQELAGE